MQDNPSWLNDLVPNHKEAPKHRLIFLRIATKKDHSRDGFLYRHTWETGFQDLVFSTHGEARDFEKEANQRELSKTLS